MGWYPRNAFIPFSAGPRACIGRKYVWSHMLSSLSYIFNGYFTHRFFETEGIMVLTATIMRYKIEIKDEAKFSRESFEERKKRVLETRAGLSLTCVD